MTEDTIPRGQTARRPLPEALREALHRDMRPVRPLLPPITRAILVLSIALIGAGILLAIVGVRPDQGRLGPGSLWGPAVMRIGVGFFLLFLALREGVPGSGGPSRVQRGALAGTAILLLALTEWGAAGGAASVPSSIAPGMRNLLGCYPKEILVALPALLLFSWLLARAYPLRPVFAATAGATGAALVADAVLHLTCPMTALSHTLFVHGGAVASIAAVAAGLGWFTIRR